MYRIALSLFLSGQFREQYISSCSAVCPTLDLSTGLIPSSNDGSVGSVVTFGCEDGRHLSSDVMILCGPDGTWSGSPPTCTEGGEVQMSCICTVRS
jgi:hypothetical protein